MSGEDLRVLADEQAALRRVATLVAAGAAPEDVFAAVVEEVGRLLPVDFADMGRYEPGGRLAFVASWGSPAGESPVGRGWSLEGRNLGTVVFETGRPARMDGYDNASGPLGVGGRERGFRAAVGTPILVEGSLWGVMIAGSTLEQPMPADTEARVVSFTELLATAVANAESRAGLTRLTDEQAALRRVATQVARGSSPEEVSAAVVEEVGRLLPVDVAAMGRYEPDGTVRFVAAWGSAVAPFLVGRRQRLGGDNLMTTVFKTGRPARIDRYADASGPIGVSAREAGLRSSVGSPVLLEGRLWGAITAGSTLEQPMPADTEARLAGFTELVATAIANAESRTGLARLADEQAGLRRVATLVALGAPAEDVFAAVTREVGRLLSIESAHLGRYESDRTVTFLAAAGGGDALLPVGTRLILGGRNVSTLVFETGRPARIDSYADASGAAARVAIERGMRTSVGTPVLVEGRLWGVIVVSSSREPPLPDETEAQLTSFTELLATAVANAESRAGLARLADEQAALRRVATLVARSAAPADVVGAVVEEVVRLLPVEYALMGRYESNDTLTIVASSGNAVDDIHPGTRLTLGETNLARRVLETRRPGRMDSSADAHGRLAVAAREAGVRSAVAAPVTVDGRLWGVMSAASTVEQRRLAETEARLAEFTELVATAIANAESRAALAASRARIVAATDQARRRIERDLHDGTQQRLVSLGLELRAAQATVPSDLAALEGDLSRVAEGLASVFDEVREISRGIHPAILSERGLGPALRALGRRSPVPVEFDLHTERRLPEPLEVAVYYVVSEALTNAAKHAHATMVHVDLEAGETTVRLAIGDDGIGGADPGKGSGLIGLRDRIEALHGTLRVVAPAGRGTALHIEIPVGSRDSAAPPNRVMP